MNERVKVLYIAGAGRSGTTLLDCMLGQTKGLFSAGEVTHLWHRGLVGDELCGCGQPFSQCPLWTEVVERALGPQPREPRRLLALRDSVCGLANLPRIVYPALRTRRFRSSLARYATILTGVYTALRDVTRCDVIVDSSKYPPEAYLLREMPGVQAYIVHLVRNANAVAYAWKKRMWRPDVHDRPEPMPRYPAVQTAMAWNVFNWVIERLGRQGTPYLRVRYEDLVARPRSTLGEICRLIGRRPENLDFVGDGRVELAPNHTVSGNPARFHHGEVSLRLDREWERQVPRGRKALVNALTYPLQRRYGYLRSQREAGR